TFVTHCIRRVSVWSVMKTFLPIMIRCQHCQNNIRVKYGGAFLTGYIVAILLGTGLLLYARRLRFISRGELIGAALGLMVILEFATSFAVIRKGTFEKPKVSG